MGLDSLPPRDGSSFGLFKALFGTHVRVRSLTGDSTSRNVHEEQGLRIITIIVILFVLAFIFL